MKFSGLVKDGLNFLRNSFQKLSIRGSKRIATFIAFGGIADASWVEQENFNTWEALEEFFE